MAIEQVMAGNISSDAVAAAFLGSALGFIIALGVMIAFLFIAAVYVYFAAAWYSIAKKLGHKKPWLAWIPFANIAMMLQLGGFNWVWVFLLIIPILGWAAVYIMLIVATWRVFDRRGYPGWFSLSLVIPEVGLLLYLVAIGFVAWKDKRSVRETPAKKKR